MPSDPELLQRYARDGDEAAFRELVRRHINFVYAAAARQASNSSRAEDVAQQVFVDLARKADRLAGRREISSWLHVSTRYIALRLVRTEARREAREREAQMIEDSVEQPHWTRMQPVIDEALSSLGKVDRSVILLRYFRNLTYPEIAQILRSNDGAVRRRADRALIKLRRALARAGIACTAQALAEVLEAAPSAAPPAGLTAAATNAALVASTAPSSAAGLFQGLRSWSQARFLAGAVGSAALIILGFAWRTHLAVERNLQSLTAEKTFDEHEAAHLAAANKAADDAQRAYDRLNAQYQFAGKKTTARYEANGKTPISMDAQLQHWAVLKLNTLHAETDMPFVRRMRWSSDKIQTFLDYEAVESRVTGILVDGVYIMIRDDQHLLRNAVSDGAPEDDRQGDLLYNWLGSDGRKFDGFLWHNNSYYIAGHVAEQLDGLEPLSADQAAALTQAFLHQNVSIAPSPENWADILAACTTVLSPAQLELIRLYATAVTGGDFSKSPP